MENRKVTTYNEADGVKGFQFYDRASCKLSDGTLIFGGTQGLTIFNPQNVNTNQQISLLFETLKVHNEIMLPGKNGCIEESMEESPHIHLSYKQNSFSIAFSAIDYSDYKHIHYFYQWQVSTIHGLTQAITTRRTTLICLLATTPSRSRW